MGKFRCDRWVCGAPQMIRRNLDFAQRVLFDAEFGSCALIGCHLTLHCLRRPMRSPRTVVMSGYEPILAPGAIRDTPHNVDKPLIRLMPDARHLSSAGV